MSIPNAIRALAKGGKVIAKGGRKVYTIVEIGNTALDVVQLGDELARLILQGDYDPKVRDLSIEVAKEGKAHDEVLTQVIDAKRDIDNLYGGINSLYEIFLDYGDKQELVIKQLKELDDLKQQLLKILPTTYKWFETIRAKANRSDYEGKLKEIQEKLGPDYLLIGFSSADLGIRALYMAYKRYQKNRSKPGFNRERSMDIFDGNAPGGGNGSSELPDSTDNNRTSTKGFKSRAKKIIKVVVNVGQKITTAGSFAMNIYGIIKKVEAHQKAVNDLEEMLTRYKKETPIYNAALNGCMDDKQGTINQKKLDTVAEFFDIRLDLDSEDTKDSLAKGYNKIVVEYNTNIKTTLNGRLPDSNEAANSSGSIEQAYTTMIAMFKEAKIDESDNDVLSNLERSYDKFQSFKQIAEDETKPSEDRKNKLDEIKREFIESVSKELNKILTQLEFLLDDYQSLKILNEMANLLNNEEAAREIQRKNKVDSFRKKYPNVPKEMIDEMVDDVMPSLDEDLKSKINAKAESAETILNIATKKRSKFKTREEIQEALTKLMEELKAKPPVTV